MTKHFIFPVIFALIAMACSSSTTTQSGCTTQECLDQLDGTAGSTSDSSTGGSDGTGGSSAINTDGTGGSVGGNSATTGTTGGDSTGGNAATGGSQTTTTTCIPRTCNDVLPAWTTASQVTKPTACGSATDGCGGLLNCGSCTTDGTANTDCGQAPTTSATGVDFATRGLKPIANVCGTRCVKALDIGACPSKGDPSVPRTAVIFCTSSIPPVGLTGCTSLNASQNSWCCDQ